MSKRKFSTHAVAQLLTGEPLPYVNGKDFVYTSEGYPCFPDIPPERRKGVDSEEAGLITGIVGIDIGKSNAFKDAPLMLEHQNGLKIGRVLSCWYDPNVGKNGTLFYRAHVDRGIFKNAEELRKYSSSIHYEALLNKDGTIDKFTSVEISLTMNPRYATKIVSVNSKTGTNSITYSAIAPSSTKCSTLSRLVKSSMNSSEPDNTSQTVGQAMEVETTPLSAPTSNTTLTPTSNTTPTPVAVEQTTTTGAPSTLQQTSTEEQQQESVFEKISNTDPKVLELEEKSDLIELTKTIAEKAHRDELLIKKLQAQLETNQQYFRQKEEKKNEKYKKQLEESQLPPEQLEMAQQVRDPVARSLILQLNQQSRKVNDALSIAQMRTGQDHYGGSQFNVPGGLTAPFVNSPRRPEPLTQLGKRTTLASKNSTNETPAAKKKFTSTEEEQEEEAIKPKNTPVAKMCSASVGIWSQTEYDNILKHIVSSVNSSETFSDANFTQVRREIVSRYG